MHSGVLGLCMLHMMCETVRDVISCRCALHTDLSFKGGDVCEDCNGAFPNN